MLAASTAQEMGAAGEAAVGDVARASPRQSPGPPSAPELSGGLSAALIADDDLRLDDVAQKVLGTGKVASVTKYNMFSGQVPALGVLQTHDAVLVWGGVKLWGAAKNQQLGDVLADYVDGGGGVVVATFGVGSNGAEWTPTGRFSVPTYWCLNPQNNQISGEQGLGVVYQPGHPLIEDVLTFDGGTSSFRVVTTAVAGATLIADWTDGEPLIATKDVGCARRVDLNLYPPSSSVSPGFWIAATDGDEIMANALAWVAQPPPARFYCTAGVSAVGCQAGIAATGTASATASSGFVLSAANVEGGTKGLFFFGSNGRQATPWGTGTSYQCVVPPVTRADLLTSVGAAGHCNASFSQDLNALWCPACPKPQKNPGAGSIVQAQLWYRDPQNTSNQTTSLSDAIEFCVAP